MDELELLKKDWKKREGSFHQISEKEIYGMLHKGSSSIVKWILIISILEFLILRILDLSIFLDNDYSKRMKENHIYDFEKIVTIFNFVILLVFIYFFYQNLKTINSSSSVKKLMQDIINTRKIVKYYVWYNLVLVGFTSAIVIYCQFMYDKNINQLYDKYEMFFILGGFFFVLIILFLFWLFYKLLYGILLRRLQKNYNELKKIDY